MGLSRVLVSAILSGLLAPGQGILVSQADVGDSPSAGAAMLIPGSAAKPSMQAKAMEAYGRLPLHFEANQGQTDPQVRFLARGRGYTLFLTPTEAVLVFTQLRNAEFGMRNEKSAASSPKFRSEEAILEDPQSAFAIPHSAVLRMRLVGATAAPKVSGLEELPGKVNYFLGNDPKKWRTNIPTYGKVTYQDIYPGVDLVYHGNQGRLEYDFVVAPGVDPRAIKLSFEGADKVEIDARGDLVLSIAGGEIRQQRPLVYQELGGVKQAVPGRYVIRDKYQVGFHVAAYDGSRPLIIDPVLSYSTYLGGLGVDSGNGIAVDASGNAYVTGRTYSADFPRMGCKGVLPGLAPWCAPAFALQTEYGEGGDAFVTKLSATGRKLIYSTYLGGMGTDSGNGIAVDRLGRAYVTGSTTSTNFPTTVGAYDRSCGTDGNCNPDASGSATSDAFVAKLNRTGSRLVYSTYLGGSAGDAGYGIAVDGSSRAYVTGYTFSTDFPTAPCIPLQQPPGRFPGPRGCFPVVFQPSLRGGYDAFVTKFSATGRKLLYSTYLGGSGHDLGYGIAVDGGYRKGRLLLGVNAYVTGETRSVDNPNTPEYEGFPLANPFQPLLRGGSDAFVTKLDPSGRKLVYSTYLGGSSFESGRGIAVDRFGNAYVTGETRSADFPTANAFQAGYGGGLSNAFVAKLTPSGTSLVYSTYLGGKALGTSVFGIGESGNGIAVDAAGNAYVTGHTRSTNFPTVRPFQAAYRGDGDAFVAKLSPAGFVLYSTYLGGSDPVGSAEDSGDGIAVDGAGNAYVTGFTRSSNFPKANPLQASNEGQIDAFITKIADMASGGADLAVTKSASPDPVPAGSNITYTIVVTNNGPNDATGVTVIDKLSREVTFVSATFVLPDSTQGSCGEAGKTVFCNLGNLAPNVGSATVTIVVTPNRGP